MQWRPPCDDGSSCPDYRHRFHMLTHLVPPATRPRQVHHDKGQPSAGNAISALLCPLLVAVHPQLFTHPVKKSQKWSDERGTTFSSYLCCPLRILLEAKRQWPGWRFLTVSLYGEKLVVFYAAKKTVCREQPKETTRGCGLWPDMTNGNCFSRYIYFTWPFGREPMENRRTLQNKIKTYKTWSFGLPHSKWANHMRDPSPRHNFVRYVTALVQLNGARLPFGAKGNTTQHNTTNVTAPWRATMHCSVPLNSVQSWSGERKERL